MTWPKQRESSWTKLNVAIAACALAVSYVGVAAAARLPPFSTSAAVAPAAIGPSAVVHTSPSAVASSTPAAFQPPLQEGETLLNPIRCEEAAGLRSSGLTASQVTFYNARETPIWVFWITGSGELMLGRKLEAHAMQAFNSVDGHYWMIQAPLDRCINIYLVRAYRSAVVIRSP